MRVAGARGAGARPPGRRRLTPMTSSVAESTEWERTRAEGADRVAEGLTRRREQTLLEEGADGRGDERRRILGLEGARRSHLLRLVVHPLLETGADRALGVLHRRRRPARLVVLGDRRRPLTFEEGDHAAEHLGAPQLAHLVGEVPRRREAAVGVAVAHRGQPHARGTQGGRGAPPRTLSRRAPASARGEAPARGQGDGGA